MIIDDLGHRKQGLHFKHKELDFPGMSMKKIKEIHTVTQKDTCFSSEHFTGNDKKHLWENPEDRSIE